MTDTLTTFGHQFQIKVVSALITDRTFMTQIYDIIQPEYFDSESIKFLVKNIKFYFNEYKSLPTADVIKVQMDSITVESLKVETKKAFVDVWQSFNSPDLAFVKSTILDFCRNQELKKAILMSADLLKHGKYDDIKVIIDKAIKAGAQDNSGLDYLNDIEYRYSEDSVRTKIPTGWGPLDTLIGGGLPKGNMAMISMPSGTGKSYFLCRLAAHALKTGFNVGYYTLELDDKYVAKRIDAALTGIPISNLPDNIDQIKSRLAKLKGKLYIKKYPAKRASLTVIEGHIEKLELLGTRLDLVIIDDPELLKFSERSEQRRDDQKIQELYEEIRGMADEKDFAVWVPSQSNRTALNNKGPAGAAEVAGSYGKIFTVDLAIFGDRRGKHKINDTADFKIEKSRLGPDGMILPSTFATSNCYIEMFDPRTDGSVEKNNEVDDKDYMRKYYTDMVSGRQSGAF